jgi:CYTH domain-containing protein
VTRRRASLGVLAVAALAALLPDAAAAHAFAPPPWAGTELTGDARYANQSLALHGLPVDRG